MALFKITIKQSGQHNGCKIEKGMEVGMNIKPLMGGWTSYLDIKQK